MTDESVDAVIIGAGITGAMTAATLAKAGKRVVVLEAGPDIDAKSRSDAVGNFMKNWPKTPNAPYPQEKFAPRPDVIQPDDYYVQHGPDLFKSNYERRVGGTLWHWLGTTLRFLPNDFRMQSRYGVGVDWPVSYADLEPWYGKAEDYIGVAGDDAAWQNFLGANRSTGFPMQPIWPTYLDNVLSKSVQGLYFEGLPVAVSPTPQGRNSQPYQDRPTCAGNTSCVAICPIHAKFDATIPVKQARDAGAEIRPKSVVTFMHVGAGGEVAAVDYKTWDGRSHRIKAKLFVMAAHAMESPKIMLMSRQKHAPNGLANRSDEVGRNLMDHNVKLSYGLAEEPLYPFRGPMSTSGIESLRDGDFRAQRGAFRIEVGNDGWLWPTGAPYADVNEQVSKGLIGKELKTALRSRVTRQIRFGSLLEMLPDRENRIRPSETKVDALGVPRPSIQYDVGDYCRKGFQAAGRAHSALFKALDAKDAVVDMPVEYFGAGHVIGTCRMGDDPKTSVVDKQMRAHDHPNLFVLGSSTFPTCTTANPTLTITALALRAQKTILEAC